MVSTATTRNRLNKQGTGDNTNTWGSKLNNEVFDLIDSALDGVASVTVSGDVTLTSTNYVADQARMRILKLSGAGGFTITIPGVEKWYWVRNACSAAVSITAGGTSVSVPAGQTRSVLCDGTDCYLGDDGAAKSYVDSTFLPLAGGTMTGNLVLVGAPSSNLHPATKLYVDNLAFAAVDLPAQSGNSGKYLTTDGTNASWDALTIAFSAVTSKPTTISGYGITDAEPLLTYTQTSGNVNPAVANTHYGVDSTTAARTITLPTPPAGRIIVSDRDGNALTNNITIARNTNTIAGASSDYVINTSYGWVELIGSSGDWKIARGG